MTATFAPPAAAMSRPPALARLAPWLLGGATVLAEIAYPLVSGHDRDVLTVLTVLLFFLASVSHALAWRGPRWAALLVLVTAGVGLLAESVGTHTGLPFGRYDYATTLGRKLASVPVVIPLAWTMMAYPALLVGRVLAAGARWAQPLVAGYALASWDLFLDPQMVRAGAWRWTHVGVHLPGSPTVPVSNYLGWLAVATAMMALLSWLLAGPPRWLLPSDRRRLDDRLPLALYLWTYASSVLANVAFFHRPMIALVGGLGMGVVAVPLAARLAPR